MLVSKEYDKKSFCIFRFDMADKIDLAVGCDSFRLANPPPWTACLNYASLEVRSS